MSAAADGTWAVRIERLPIELAVGIHAHEQPPQPVQVSLVIKGRALASPESLAECIDYEPLLRWLTGEWPRSAHVGLLETRLNELFERCFALDLRVDSVWAGLYKVALARGAACIGMERAVTRREFAAQRRSTPRPATLAALQCHGNAPH